MHDGKQLQDAVAFFRSWRRAGVLQDVDPASGTHAFLLRCSDPRYEGTRPYLEQLYARRNERNGLPRVWRHLIAGGGVLVGLNPKLYLPVVLDQFEIILKLNRIHFDNPAAPQTVDFWVMTHAPCGLVRERGLDLTGALVKLRNAGHLLHQRLGKKYPTPPDYSSVRVRYGFECRWSDKTPHRTYELDISRAVNGSG